MVKKLLVLFFLTLLPVIASDKIRLKFITNDSVSPLLLIKLIELGLDKSNARIAFVNEFLATQPFVYSVDVWKDRSLNLNNLNELFLKSGVKILRTDRYENGIDIELRAKSINLAVNNVNFDEDVILERSNSAYFINTNDAKYINIMPRESSQWIPLARIYDKNLNEIKNIEYKVPASQLKFKLDSDAGYVLVSDSIDNSNIKGGLILKFYKE